MRANKIIRIVESQGYLEQKQHVQPLSMAVIIDLTQSIAYLTWLITMTSNLHRTSVFATKHLLQANGPKIIKVVEFSKKQTKNKKEEVHRKNKCFNVQ